MTRKTLIAVAISTAFAVPVVAFGDDDATRWPDKAQTTPQTQTTKERVRGTTRADEAMSGSDGAAARGSTRPIYEPPLRPADAKPIPPFREGQSAASGGTAAKRK
jgi:hypothetical protein